MIGTPHRSARAYPIRLIESGPAAGAMAAAYYSSLTGVENLISFDMGGTSTDVSLIRAGQATKRSVVEMAGFPVRVPT